MAVSFQCMTKSTTNKKKNASFSGGLGEPQGFPGGSDGKESACSARNQGSIPGLGTSPGEKNDNPLQYSCLENPMDRGVW